MPKESSWSQCAHPHGEPLPAQISTGNPPTLAGRSGSVSCLFTYSFPLSLDAHKILFVPSKRGVIYFSQSYGNPIIKSHKSSKSYSLWISSTFARSPGFAAWHEAHRLHNIRRISLMLSFSRFWVTWTVVIELDFMVFAPLLPSCCSFFRL